MQIEAIFCIICGAHMNISIIIKVKIPFLYGHIAHPPPKKLCWQYDHIRRVSSL